MTKPILEVQNLSAFYREGGGGFFLKGARKQVLYDLSFEIQRDEILGLVGESGTGKTTLSKVILGLESDYRGKVIYREEDSTSLPLLQRQRRPQMIFQDPYGSLNPRMTVRQQVEEPLKIQGGLQTGIQGGMSWQKRQELVREMLDLVGLDEQYLDRYSKELSGGQRQRVSIAIALISKPRLLIADEPVSSLDATIRAQVLDLLLDLQQKLKLSYLFISHDLAVIEQVCHRLLVMQHGRIVEAGTVAEVFANPQHAYTKELLKASFGT